MDVQVECVCVPLWALIVSWDCSAANGMNFLWVLECRYKQEHHTPLHQLESLPVLPILLGSSCAVCCSILVEASGANWEAYFQQFLFSLWHVLPACYMHNVPWNRKSNSHPTYWFDTSLLLCKQISHTEMPAWVDTGLLWLFHEVENFRRATQIRKVTQFGIMGCSQCT